jgi:hypothetical protein
MVIRTEYRGQRYSMGSSDPLPTGFKIRFGGLNFQATGNGYLMRLTNREELRARRQAGSVPVAAAHVALTPALASTDAAGPSAPRHRRRSGQRSRQARSERRHATRVASQRDALTNETTAARVGERSVSGPRFPIGLCGATTAYVASANTNAAMRRVPLAAISWSPGILAPPPAMSHPKVPPKSCRPPLRMDMRSGTSLAYRTQ